MYKRHDYQDAVIFGHSIDRSPCGVGTCAKMATLVAKGELNIGDKLVYESIIRTKFSGRPLEKTKVGDYDAIIPEVTASAYITGFTNTQLGLLLTVLGIASVSYTHLDVDKRQAIRIMGINAFSFSTDFFSPDRMRNF